MWEVEYTDQFEAWWDTLTITEQAQVNAAVESLEQNGPALKRPLVGEIQGSDFDPQMKELIPPGTRGIRILFMFDPRRTAILLVGGNKSGEWKSWYRQAVPLADDLYREHLEEVATDG